VIRIRYVELGVMQSGSTQLNERVPELTVASPIHDVPSFDEYSMYWLLPT
jgi:hypothetical protein